MQTLFDILSLTIIVVFIVDISGFTDSWKGWLHKWLKVPIGRVRPFDCSLCSTWWAGIVYLICTGHITLPWVACVAVCAMLTPWIQDTLRTILDILTTITNKITELCNRNN